MQEPLHAHEVLNLVVNNPGKFTVDTLKEEVNTQFGSEARFTNCSGYIFDVDRLLQFLSSRGKIEINESGIDPVRHNICQH